MTAPAKSSERRLTDIVREVKIAAAERSDVVVDMRDADRARLELLAEELASVIEDINPADDRFDFGISTGQQPRFWIDAVAHVHMGPDRRVYRVVRDTRLGRIILEETTDVKSAADAVGRYVAERVIERERILSGDLEPVRGMRNEPGWEDGATARQGAVEETEAVHTAPIEPAPAIPERKQPKDTGFVIGASWFIIGCVVGAAALVGAFWDRISALLG
ncbi:MAG: hypothetical protein CML29_15690 [Rhizobiales bacterium]|nr:hypothetical protein [Hyphomicrobiales bacterium]MBA70784.1 hypothetical protein [Hyphomicrobiales bacterium]